MAIAYVFAHAPEPSVASDAYVRRLLRFHDALAADPPTGLVDSWVWRLDSGPVGAGYEDWYLVEDWAALGVLGDAAVSGSRHAPHDASAALSGEGAGAVYAPVFAPAGEATHRLRVDKPRGVPYDAFHARLRSLPGVVAVWQRQLVLGRDREFLVDLQGPPLPPAVGAFGAQVDVAGLVTVRGRSRTRG